MFELINKLLQKKIYLSYTNEGLKLKYDEGIHSEDELKSIIEEIRNNKEELITYLKQHEHTGEFSYIQNVLTAPSYPLSISQQRLWVACQYEDGLIAYNIPNSTYLNKYLDIKSFKKAIDLTIERHEILRTVFRENEKGEIRQWILKKEELGFEVDFKDYRNEPKKRDLVNLYVNEQSSKPFNLSTGPLFSASLLQVEDNEYVFYYCMHHIISDGWSMEVLSKDVLRYYESLVENKSIGIKDLRIQYKDYSAWQQSQLDSDKFKEHKNYWLKQFEGQLPIIELPIDFERPRIKTYNGQIVSRVYSKDLSRRFKLLCQEGGCTLFMGLISAVDVLLYRYTGQEDLIIGSPISGRNHADLEDQIGFYLNNIAIRSNINEKSSFQDLLKQNRQTTLNAYQYQDYPIDELVNALQLKRDLSRGSLFDVMVLLQNFIQADYSSQEKSFENLQEKDYEGVKGNVSKYDLTFYFQEASEQIVLDIEYNCDLFSAEKIKQIDKFFELLLQKIVEHSHENIDRIIQLSLENIGELAQNYGADLLCSEHQKRLWFIDQFETNYLYENSPIYHNLPLLIQLEDVLNVEKLNASIAYVKNRYDILRSNVITKDGVPCRLINDSIQSSIKIHELNSSDLQNIRSKCIEIINKPFDIAVDQLIRFDLIVTNNSNVFLITGHNLIVDRTSLRCIFKIVMNNYHGKSNEILEEIQFNQFAAWQKTNISEIHPALFYWKKKLKDAPILYLDTDKPREHVHIYQAADKYKFLNNDVSKRVQNYCTTNNISPNIFFLSVFKLLLHRYTNSDELIIGNLYQNRDDLRFENLIGPLANLITLKTIIDQKSNFQSILEQMRVDYKNSVSGAVIPFEKVVLDVNPGKDMSRTALFDILFHYDEKPDYEWNGFEFKEIELNYGLGKYDLNLLVKQEETFTFYLTYNQIYFDNKRMEDFLEHYSILVQEVLDKPSHPISTLDYLSEKDKNQLIYGFNEAETNYPKDKTIVDLFEEQVAINGDRVALSYQGEEISYSELNRYSNQLADYLRNEYSLQPDDLVALKQGRGIWLIISILGTLKSGAAYLPIDPDLPKDRIDFIVKDSESKILLDDNEIETFKKRRNEFSEVNLEKVNKPSNLAYVIYTSGTTGKPKGSLIEHKNVIRLFKTDKNRFDFNENDIWTMFHSYSFDFSVWEIFGALLFGGKLIVVSSEVTKDSNQFLELLKDKNVTVLNQTPSSFYNLINCELDQGDSKLNLRYIIFGGEALNPSKLKEWKLIYPNAKLINMYGITETTVHVTYKEIQLKEIEMGQSNIGLPIPTLSCYVLDQYGQLSPVGVTGELFVGGEGVARGYLNRTEITDYRFVYIDGLKGKLFRSGDKVKRLFNGELEYIGRFDDQVKIRGYRIELGEIEHALLKNEDIETACVLVNQLNSDENELVAYFTSKTEHHKKDLKTFLKEILPEYMIPSHFVKLEAIPLNSNGKIDKKRLPDLGGIALDNGVSYQSPKNIIEDSLIEILVDILKKPKDVISVNDNFFDMGISSISLMRLLSTINRQFNSNLKAVTLFEHSTVRALSNYMNDGKTIEEEVGMENNLSDSIDEMIDLM